MVLVSQVQPPLPSLPSRTNSTTPHHRTPHHPTPPHPTPPHITPHHPNTARSNHVEKIFLNRFYTYCFVYVTYMAWCIVVQVQMGHVSHTEGSHDDRNHTYGDDGEIDDFSAHESRLWHQAVYEFRTTPTGYFLAFSDCLLAVQGLMFMQIEVNTGGGGIGSHRSPPAFKLTG